MDDRMTSRSGTTRSLVWSSTLPVAAVIGILLPMVAVAGTAGGPDEFTPLSTPTGNPAEAGPVMQVDLHAAIDLALESNPALSATRHDVETETARRDASRSALWPTLDGVVGFTGYRRDQRIYSPGSPDAPTVISHQFAWAQVEGSVPLFRGGRTRASVQVADHSLEGVRHQGDRAQAELVFEVSRLYYEILAQREYCASITAAQNTLGSQRDEIDALVQERKAAPVDGQRVQVRLASLELTRRREENRLSALERTLSALLGRDGQDSALEVVGTLSPPAPPLLPEAREAVAEALTRRPDYLAAKAVLAGETEQGAAARAEHLPELWLKGSYGMRWALWPTLVSEGATPLADVGEAGLVLDVPLLEGGKVRAEVHEQNARIGAASERLREFELRVSNEVQAAILDYTTAADGVGVAASAVDLARSVFDVETEKYNAGKNTITDVLSAQAALLDAQTGLARAQADSHIALAALSLALGEQP